MTKNQTKLDELRDSLAEAVAAFCHCAGPTCSGCEETSKKLWKDGWDAAMERAQVLVDAINEILKTNCICYGECYCGVRFDLSGVLMSALEKFYEI